jgi:hypothetical protein
MSTPANKPLEITRRSGWSSFMKVIGWLCVVLGSIGLGASMALNGGTSEKTTILIAIAIGIQSLFLAFVIDVITDIRWFLKEISFNSKSQK